MDRRQVLLSSVALLTMGGCLGDDSSHQERFEESFRVTLENDDTFELIETQWQADVFVVDHRSSETDENQLELDIGKVAGGIASAMDVHEPAMELTRAEVYTSSDEKFGEYEIDPEWVMAFNSDELTESEYAQNVLDTFSYV